MVVRCRKKHKGKFKVRCPREKLRGAPCALRLRFSLKSRVLADHLY